MNADLFPLLQGHPFFAGLAPEDLALVAECARRGRFEAGEFLAREGELAAEFFLVLEGRVAISLPAPRGDRLVVETIEAGEVVGWSWLLPPHIWMYDVSATAPVEALVMDGWCLRGKCDADPRLGYDLMQRFSRLMATRLAATRMQMMDLYRAGRRAVGEGKEARA
jgi:CRP/FNR family cyclic AMP-dependent transcriptional regulator